ncbi:MAG: DUF4297 domain-containing protein [Deltaproteobacteria bacterium]|nr:DUF4297 domain-containing protein [Deltaproteobacteria bacterium]
MRRKTYSIRKGFEFQDLFCAATLLQLVQDKEYSTQFEIECDNVDYIDDMVLYRQSGFIGHQVKYHTTLGTYESFDSLMKTSDGKRSLLQKLHEGWKTLSGNGETSCQIVFVSSSPAEPGRGNLGDAIESENRRIGDRFFSDGQFKKQLKNLLEHLVVSQEDLRKFLCSITWKMGILSIDGLKTMLSTLMKNIGFPFGPDALSCIIQAVGSLATEHSGRKSINEFVCVLSKYPILREVCERLFPDIVISKTKRACHVRVAVISLDCLPAFQSHDFTCLEEPLPLRDYRNGTTGPTMLGVLDEEHATWKNDYMTWHQERVLGVLTFLESRDVDIIVFPRFALPLDVSSAVLDWCRMHKCNCALGGHSMHHTGPDAYRSSLAVTLEDDYALYVGDGNLVLHVLLRYDRNSRYVASVMRSPYAKQEKSVRNDGPTVLPCRDGWLNVILIDSPDMLKQIETSKCSLPELIICSCGEHGDSLYDSIHDAKQFTNIPVVFASASTLLKPLIFIAGQDDSILRSNRWEGVVIADLQYTRGDMTTLAKVDSIYRFSIIYTNAPLTDNRNTDVNTAGGFTAAVSEAKTAPDRCLILRTDDPGSFFIRRSNAAEKNIRDILRDSSPETIRQLSDSLKSINEARREYESAVTTGPEKQLPHVPILRTSPSINFVDRTNLIKRILLFVEGDVRHQVLVVCGPAGIGKRELINESQRQDHQRNNWLRFRCVKDTTFWEVLSQLYDRLGIDAAGTLQPGLDTYERLWQHLATKRCRTLVLEDAQNLPIFESDTAHTELMACLSVLCKKQFEHAPRVIMLSELRGDYVFSHSHLLDVLRLDGLTEPDTVHLLRELTSFAASQYPPPTTSELTKIAGRIHGHPVLAQIVASLLEQRPTAEVIDSLHERKEIRQYVINRLLGKTSVSPAELRFLALASIYRQPVHISAFREESGAEAREIAADLANRFLLNISNGIVAVHPLLADHFLSQRTSEADRIKYHRIAFKFYEQQYRYRRLTQDEMIERVYHGIRGSIAIPLKDIQGAVGPVRTAMFDAMRNRNWDEVIRTADMILGIFPDDPTIRVAKATCLDAIGRHKEADQFFDSITNLDGRYGWVGVEFARSRIRRKDFDGAERILYELEHKFGNDIRVQVARAQFLDAQGLHDKAMSLCEHLLRNSACHEWDAFYAGLILRHANALESLIQYVEERCDGYPSNNNLTRLFAYACVVTKYAPDHGLEMLSRLYHDDPHNGYTVADYAYSLSRVGRQADAKLVFEKGMSERRMSSRFKAAILTEYADFLNSCQEYSASHEIYRELIKIRRYDVHVRRRFARSLLDAAGEAHRSQNSQREDACVQEAIVTLQGLLVIAPQDKWAADLIHRAEHRIYG